MKKDDLHIGCSSFYNISWKEIFYPEELPRKEWFNYYCKHFNTYEINATFYRFPTLKSLQNWHYKTPTDFLFAVKAPKTITHLKKFVNCKQEIGSFYEIVQEGLKQKLGCILFQLPPSFQYTPEHLSLVVNSLNPDFENVIEFRNKTWWRKEVFDCFATHNITFCSVNFPNLPTDIIKTNTNAYIRLHGSPKLFYSSYTDDELMQLAASFSNTTFNKVFVYFNNTASTAGILNAIFLKRMNDL